VRTPYRNSSYATLIAVVAVLFAIASVVAYLANHWPIEPVIAVFALSAFCLLRLARAGVYADAEGIRVLNPLRTVRIPWERVQRFTLRAHGGFPAVGFAELVDGERVQIWGIQARSHTLAARRIPEEVVAALNERLAQERAGARPPTP
jgi:hypothetical protein